MDYEVRAIPSFKTVVEIDGTPKRCHLVKVSELMKLLSPDNPRDGHVLRELFSVESVVRLVGSGGFFRLFVGGKCQLLQPEEVYGRIFVAGDAAIEYKMTRLVVDRYDQVEEKLVAEMVQMHQQGLKNYGYVVISFDPDVAESLRQWSESEQGYDELPISSVDGMTHCFYDPNLFEPFTRDDLNVVDWVVSYDDVKKKYVGLKKK